MNYIVYKTTNKINGKVYVGVHRTNPDIFDGYIGCGVNYKDKKNKCLKGFPAAVRKYGYENFKRETLFIYPDTEEGFKLAYKKEAEIVNLDWVKSRDNYNLSLGGRGGNYDPTRCKIIAQYTIDGKFIRTWSSILEAKTMLLIPNISNCLNGTNKSAGNFQWKYFNGDESDIAAITIKEKTIYQFDLQGNLIKVWKSITEASHQFSNPNSARSSISNILEKKNRQAFGYYWSTKHIFDYDPSKNSVAVACYDDDGNFIKSFTTITEAANEFKCSIGNISAVIKGQWKHVKGVRWRYFYGNTENIKPLK